MEELEVLEKELKWTNRKKEKWELEGEALRILEQRKEAAEEGNLSKFEELNNNFRKVVKKEKTKKVTETMREELDERDRWMGIRMLKKGYTPNPYYRKAKGGIHIEIRRRAQETANYLKTAQWGKEEKEQEKEKEREIPKIVHKGKISYRKNKTRRRRTE